MARATGLEPATSGVTGRHSNQLSYTRAKTALKAAWGRFKGAPYPCQAYVRRFAAALDDPILVGGDGLEPPTLSV